MTHEEEEEEEEEEQKTNVFRVLRKKFEPRAQELDNWSIEICQKVPGPHLTRDDLLKEQPALNEIEFPIFCLFFLSRPRGK